MVRARRRQAPNRQEKDAGIRSSSALQNLSLEEGPPSHARESASLQGRNNAGIFEARRRNCQEATGIVQESCLWLSYAWDQCSRLMLCNAATGPDLSLQCFLEFTQFFSNCPPGASTAGRETWKSIKSLQFGRSPRTSDSILPGASVSSSMPRRDIKHEGVRPICARACVCISILIYLAMYYRQR